MIILERVDLERIMHVVESSQAVEDPYPNPKFCDLGFVGADSEVIKNGNL